MMIGSESAAFFMLRLGTPHPSWAFTDDSNMLGIGDCDGVMSAMFELDRNQVARIRRLGQSVERIRCTCERAGRELHFYLHGRQVSQGVWVGVASADPDYLPTDEMIATWEVPKPDDAFRLTGAGADLIASLSLA
ncbi:hypothetical protein KDW63_15585 [Burkholderia cenocepacia]|uniref:hypothetical protein n=1 Tax=Burkholderia cenocepacia TaxID=95486 RepID=UPI000F59D5BA|nr:hypothetical protein [Burkholderia cenocepacia]MBR8295601.1 hypothetical protein [Burkholderia cenocepacia]MBR8511626.1 hypothetical protein [Burkholderia cenocepacia]MDR5664589.1 hypothetical protein [Burkholderia cenocepacia]MDR8099396.1 hypothetical protein [Burkholderia cenocepacia]RQV62015.1 hypothetical protein DF020_07935 [Burkholderia cenocepacia]